MNVSTTLVALMPSASTPSAATYAPVTLAVKVTRTSKKAADVCRTPWSLVSWSAAASMLNAELFLVLKLSVTAQIIFPLVILSSNVSVVAAAVSMLSIEH